MPIRPSADAVASHECELEEARNRRAALVVLVLSTAIQAKCVGLTAGHVMGPEVLGSIEYGVDLLDCPLVIVLGHDSCGAVGAAYAVLENGAVPAGYVRDVVERVTPSVPAARAAGRVRPEQIIAEHVRNTTDLLLSRSRVLAEKVAAGQTAVVGPRCHLADGSAQLVASHGLDVQDAATSWPSRTRLALAPRSTEDTALPPFGRRARGPVAEFG